MKDKILIIASCLLAIILIIGGVYFMDGHEKVYVVCENMCLEEGMTKEQIEEKFSDINDELPTYKLKGDFAVITGVMTMTSGAASTTVNYPEGFNKDNCVLISFGCSKSSVDTGYNYGYGIRSSAYAKGSLPRNARLTAENIQVSCEHPISESGGSGDFYFNLVLMKIA